MAFREPANKLRFHVGRRSGEYNHSRIFHTHPPRLWLYPWRPDDLAGQSDRNSPLPPLGARLRLDSPISITCATISFR